MADEKAGVLHLYTSTYCIHDRHTECRLTCKTCSAACLCWCHPRPLPPERPEGG